MLSRIRREGQRLTVNGTGVNAIQSLSFGYQSTAQPITPLGLSQVVYAPSAPQTATINTNSLLVYDDFFEAAFVIACFDEEFVFLAKCDLVGRNNWT